MKIAIVGSRNSRNLTLSDIESKIPHNCSMIISGGATGVDNMAEKVANKLKIPFVKFLPDYEIFGSTAPLVRNTKIVKNSEKVIAFWDYKSTGTAHAIRECIRLNIPVEIVKLK